MDSLKNIGGRLRAARNAMGKTGGQISMKSGIHVAVISEIELGKRKPSIINLMTLCQIYGLTPNDVLLSDTERKDLEAKRK